MFFSNLHNNRSPCTDTRELNEHEHGAHQEPPQQSMLQLLTRQEAQDVEDREGVYHPRYLRVGKNYQIVPNYDRNTDRV